MKWFVFLVGVSGLVLAGCGSTSSTHTGAIDNGGGDNGGDGGNGSNGGNGDDDANGDGVGDEDGNGGENGNGGGGNGGNGGNGDDDANGDGIGDEDGNGGGGEVEYRNPEGFSVAAAPGEAPELNADVTATYDDSEENEITISFEGGALDGRTLTFDTTSSRYSVGAGGFAHTHDDPNEGVTEGEEHGLLGLVEGDHSAGYYVNVWKEDDSGDSVVMLHSGTPTDDMPSTGTVQYTGALVGFASAGALGTEAEADISIDADFNAGMVSGIVDEIVLRDEDGTLIGRASDHGLTEVVFTGAEMSQDDATYSGEDLEIDGAPVAIGWVEGGFYGPDADETAGGLAAQSGTHSLLGAFQASRD